ncbi:hypothetical protein [Parabacteroides sp.]
MDKAPDKEELIIECAHFLKKKEILEKKSWRIFAKQFFAYYREQILVYYGYQPQDAGRPLVQVKDKYLFLAMMAAFGKTGKIDDSQKALSEVLYDGFDLGLEISTIRKLLSEILSEYSKLFDYIAKFKKDDLK